MIRRRKQRKPQKSSRECPAWPEGDHGTMKRAKKMQILVLLLLLLSSLKICFSDRPSGVCISQGGKFSPFSSDGRPPKKVSRGSKDLTLCRVFRKMTCCDAAQIHPVVLSVRALASSGEANIDCLQLWELLECSICDPQIGVQPGPPLVCASLCDRVFEVCSDAYFSVDAKIQVLAPCGASDFICGRASEWASNGTELCEAAGFSVKPFGEAHAETGERYCYGGKASVDSISGSWRTSQSEMSNKANFGIFGDSGQGIKVVPFGEKVFWAVGGMVLTAGLFFVSKKRSRRHQKLAATQRTVRKLEAKMKQRIE